jgi:hypothetical protein
MDRVAPGIVVTGRAGDAGVVMAAATGRVDRGGAPASTVLLAPPLLQAPSAPSAATAATTTTTLPSTPV